MSTFDVGDTCLWCFQDTAPGSGKWVNRIPANRDVGDVKQDIAGVLMPEGLKHVPTELYSELYATLDGYMCDDCQDFDYDCMICYKSVSDEEDVYDEEDTGHYHRDCLPRERWHPEILEAEGVK